MRMPTLQNEILTCMVCGVIISYDSDRNCTVANQSMDTYI